MKMKSLEEVARDVIKGKYGNGEQCLNIMHKNELQKITMLPSPLPNSMNVLISHYSYTHS